MNSLSEDDGSYPCLANAQFDCGSETISDVVNFAIDLLEHSESITRDVDRYVSSMHGYDLRPDAVKVLRMRQERDNLRHKFKLFVKPLATLACVLGLDAEPVDAYLLAGDGTRVADVIRVLRNIATLTEREAYQYRWDNPLALERSRVASEYRDLAQRYHNLKRQDGSEASLRIMLMTLASDAGKLLHRAVWSNAFGMQRTQLNRQSWGSIKKLGLSEYLSATILDHLTSAPTWSMVTGKWLAIAFPEYFSADVAPWDFGTYRTDEGGNWIDHEGKQLPGRWYQHSTPQSRSFTTKDIPAGAKGYLWKGRNGRLQILEFYDHMAMLEHLRNRAQVYQTACELLAQLLEAGTTALNNESQTDRDRSADVMAPGPNFLTFQWGNQSFSFTPGRQRDAIRHLWLAWESGSSAIQVEELRDLVGSSETAKPSDWFRNHPAWGQLVVTPSKGVYALKAPETPQ